MRLIFFGTPESAVPFLELCAERHEVALVVTQPDRPAGRGLELAPTPVKAAALRRSIEVLQPDKPSQVVERLRAVEADLGVVVAYGRIFGESSISSTRLGLLNVHFSLLPKYRGAAPIQWALWKGETETGVTTFWIDKGMDTGPIFLRREIPVDIADDANTLETKLVGLGVDALKETLDDIAAGDVRREPQSGEITLAPILEKSHGRISFAKPAAEVHNQVRALCRWPVAHYEVKSKEGKLIRLNVIKSTLDTSPGPGNPEPGTIVSVERGRGILVQCLPGRIWLHRVQPEGRKPMDGTEFANGFRLKVGDTL